MNKEYITKTEKIIDNLIGNLIITIVEHEKYRTELISMLDKEERKEKDSLERSYYYSGPPKVLYINIPSLPVSFNRATRCYFVRDKNVVNSLFEWWDIKIKNALDNMEYLNSDNPFTIFDKATVIVKFTFPSEILRDIDNYAIKAINDSLKGNKVMEDDNSNVIETILPIMATGEEWGIEVFVTDDDFPLILIDMIYQKHKYIFELAEKAKKEQLEKTEFFALETASIS